MPAGMTLGDDAKAFSGDLVGEFAIAQQRAQRRFDSRAVDDAQVAARWEELFDVLPRGGHDRDAARHCFEHPDRRNAGERARIRRARYMHRGASTGESGGHPMRRQPAAIVEAVEAGCLDGAYRIERISHAMDTRSKLQFSSRIEQKLLQFGAALAISPVSDPDQVMRALDLRHRSVQRNVGSLVPGERPISPAEPQVNLAQHFTEGEHAVETVVVEM